MKHIAQESLAEFVRQSLPAAEAALVKDHIAECSECSNIAGLFSAVMRVGAKEVAYEPPQGIVRAVSSCRYDGVRNSCRPGAAKIGTQKPNWTRGMVCSPHTIVSH